MGLAEAPEQPPICLEAPDIPGAQVHCCAAQGEQVNSCPGEKNRELTRVPPSERLSRGVDCWRKRATDKRRKGGGSREREREREEQRVYSNVGGARMSGLFASCFKPYCGGH